MKLALFSRFVVLVSAILTQLIPFNFVRAATFEQQEVDQSLFIAIARPYGNGQYDLLILYQIPQQRQCWREEGDKVVKVDPLLLNFDFSGSCERSTDSNGYSVRIDGEDYGLNYLLRIVERNGELFLVATNRTKPSEPELIIGRTYGITDGFLKVYLNPGWKFTKRSYQGKVLGHVYLTGDSQAMIPQDNSTSIVSSPDTPEDPIDSSSSETPSEFTFTAESSEPPDTPTNLEFDNNASVAPPVVTSNTPNPQPSVKPNSGELPPPPFSPSSLPPIAPPSQNPNSQVVPPPSLNSSQRPTLGDTLDTFNGNPLPPSSSASASGIKGYKVLVDAKTNAQQQQVRSLYPEAFRTTHNGQSFLQVGVFSTTDNAQTVIQTLKNAGLNTKMIPF
ncbi:conserved hypothetical protein [Gloeothece citriformis PCC 7424]|uniref:Sporulation domain protein n=1 Tax=Gloeothece citriformis (strain PCC 7424) TaxID=65393 RepID=B7K824_GLOC7|nr:DUF3747 domain-containing protein [Gloeothece citriformis]ACK68512.1 conserved hypothetical protein [Gloeothece citriformis PCC 7424]